MNQQTALQTQKPVTSKSLVNHNLLQRKCACGQHTAKNGGECKECKKRRQDMLQRAAVNNATVDEILPIVHEVLRSPDQPLDLTTRASMESHFGHDFSRVETNRSTGKYIQTKLSANQLKSKSEQETNQRTGEVIHSLGTNCPNKMTTSGTIWQNVLKPRVFKNSALQKRENLPITSEIDPDSQLFELGCFTDESRSRAPDCGFTDGQNSVLADAEEQARQRTRVAYNRVSAGHNYQRIVQRIARQTFFSPPPINDIVENIRKVRDLLNNPESSIQYACKTCGDTNCQLPGTVAYVNRMGEMPIFVCPWAFHPEMLPNLRRTIIHEGMHLIGIGEEPETYCNAETACVTLCGTVNSADAWAHFIDCLGQSITIRRDFYQELERLPEEL